MAAKTTIPKGTRDFTPTEMRKREYIFNTITEVFRLYGYQPIETPAMENLSTLLGKYGEEGDRLIFRILNSGNFLDGLDGEDIGKADAGEVSSLISEKGLRYDLTVPFARYVVQHRNEIIIPFKRYQIQPVWRADKPQKGRYREFFQCDADVIGSDSLLNEYELVRIIDDVFARLKIDIIIKINNRKVLSGIAGYIGQADKMSDITVAIDKIDKIGADAVNDELRAKGISEGSLGKLQPILNLRGDAQAKLSKLRELPALSEKGMKGISELETLFSYIEKTKLAGKVELDLNLARGLNYYTGAIIEVRSAGVAIGSICGGGRYDDLTGIFGLPGVSGVGVSFGADRIYDVMEQLGLFGDLSASPTTVLVVNFGDAGLEYSLGIVDKLREKGIKAELYPDPVRLKRQISYADSRKIPFVIIAGEEEIKTGEVTVKSMTTGEQKRIGKDDLGSILPEPGV